MFFDDAIIASRELELTLTGRDCGLEERAPMCGVPHHACDVYLKKLIEKGYNVAICEQTMVKMMGTSFSLNPKVHAVNFISIWKA